jgi:hypothetical protein
MSRTAHVPCRELHQQEQHADPRVTSNLELSAVQRDKADAADVVRDAIIIVCVNNLSPHACRTGLLQQINTHPVIHPIHALLGAQRRAAMVRVGQVLKHRPAASGAGLHSLLPAWWQVTPACHALQMLPCVCHIHNLKPPLHMTGATSPNTGERNTLKTTWAQQQGRQAHQCDGAGAGSANLEGQSTRPTCWVACRRCSGIHM